MEQIEKMVSGADWSVKFVFSWEIVIPWPLALFGIVCLMVIVRSYIGDNKSAPGTAGWSLILIARITRLSLQMHRVLQGCLSEIARVLHKAEKEIAQIEKKTGKEK